jgi:hypothetical protein
MNTNTTLSKGSRIQLNQSQAARAGILLLLLLLILPHLVQAQFNYVITNGTITITKYTGPVTAVTIPDTINGLPVTSIDKAFYNGATPGQGILTSITIPDSVTSIEKYAFAWNYTLTSATLGKGIRTIGDGAFADCGLTGVYFLGDAPSLRGPSVFAYDDNLRYVVID